MSRGDYAKEKAKMKTLFQPLGRKYNENYDKTFKKATPAQGKRMNTFEAIEEVGEIIDNFDLSPCPKCNNPLHVSSWSSTDYVCNACAEPFSSTEILKRRAKPRCPDCRVVMGIQQNLKGLEQHHCPRCWKLFPITENPKLQETPMSTPSTPPPATTNPIASAAFWELVRPAALVEIANISSQCASTAFAEIIKGGQPLTIEWTVNGLHFASLEQGAHKQIHAVLSRLKAGLKNILLVGPAGSGKTRLAHDVAKSLKKDFTEVSCTSGMPEWHLTGRSMPSLTSGTSVYQRSEFVRMYEEGGVFLLDEIDAADPNVLLVMNSALANGRMSIPARVEQPYATRHPDFVLIAAANTFGTGASREYVGRNQLDASTLSRFACAVVEVDYDKGLEKALVEDSNILNKIWAIRGKVQSLKLRRIVGTRELLAFTSLIRAGEKFEFALAALTEGWTADEKSKVGV